MFLDPIYETTLDREGSGKRSGSVDGQMTRLAASISVAVDQRSCRIRLDRGISRADPRQQDLSDRVSRRNRIGRRIRDARGGDNRYQKSTRGILRKHVVAQNPSWGSTRRRVVCFTHWIQTVRYRLHEHCYNVRSTSIRLRVTRTRTRGDCRRNRCRLSLFVFAGKDALSLLGSHSSGGSRRYRECLESTSAEQYSSRYLHRGD